MTLISFSGGFNPLPAFGPGETWFARYRDPIANVSIRSRPLGREKPCRGNLFVFNDVANGFREHTKAPVCECASSRLTVP